MDFVLYIERKAKKLLSRHLETFPAVTVTGPRQSGKSTFVRHQLPNFRYVNLDHTPHLLHLRDDPQGFIQTFHEHVIFDEVQKAPELFPLLKVAIDNDRHQRGRFVLLSPHRTSQNRAITESLAGRTGIMTLLPFSFEELPTPDPMSQGGYPELVTCHECNADLWFEAYIQTYLNKDVRTLANIGDLGQFQRFVRLLASRTSQTLALSHLSQELGISQPTAKRWLSVLEASFIVFTLPPYFNNFGKRIIKSPKLYFHDVGLAAHLTGIREPDHYHHGPLAGALFENYVISETFKRICHHGLPTSLYYLRTSNQTEVDLVIDDGQRLIMAEIKKSATFSPRFLKPIRQLSQNGQLAEGILIYQGEAMDVHKLRIMPVEDFLTKGW